jgi:MFS transporter, MHS family, shikimate and dehydroshikimate transport protein
MENEGFGVEFAHSPTSENGVPTMASQSVPHVHVLGRPSSEQLASIRRVAFASFIGTSIEWYDFFLYGTASALIFPKLFFPQFSPFAGTLVSFATFCVGFIARPIGGVVFGHFGDRVGRKSMLVITLLLMGGSTFLVGLLPTFSDIGVLAPLLLVVLRFLQGFAVGGEWGGATLITVEHAPEESRNFYASWPQLGVPIGVMLSTAVIAVFTSLTKGRFLTWGWRIPFLLSIVLIAVGLFIRMRIFDSPAFLRIKNLRTESRLPLLEVLRDYTVTTFLAIGAVLVNLGGYYVVITFTLSYVVDRFGVSPTVPLIGLMCAGAAQFAGILIFARVADQIGKERVAICSTGFLVVLSCLFFWLIDTGVPVLIWLAMSSWTFACGAFYGITGVFLADLFETRVRYSGVSFAFQMAAMLAGAPAPIIAAALVHRTGGASWPVAIFLVANALISFVAVCFVAQRYPRTRVSMKVDVRAIGASGAS